MVEHEPGTQVQQVCPLASALQSSPKLPQSLFVDKVAFCPEACEGIKSEPRNIGNVVLPRLFDRIYCDNTQ